MEDEKRKGCFTRQGCIVISLLLLVGFALLYSAAQEARESARRMCCVPDMLRAAMHYYHDRFGSFPPAYTTDAEGKPLHSWRTLMVLYGGYDYPEFADIRLDEPWDSEHNSQFHDMLPPFHGLYCASRPAKELTKGMSPYKMIIGPDTISNGPNCTKLSDITKDKSEVILVVETSVPVCWMKPEDLPQSALVNGVVSSVAQRGKPVVQGIGSPHYNGGGVFWSKIPGANVLMVDGCEFFTNKDISPEKLLEKSRIRQPE